MEAGDIVWLLFILFWLFSSFVASLRKKMQGKKKPAERPPARPPAPPPRPGVSQPPPPLPPTARQRPGVPRESAPAPAPAARPPSPEDALVNLLKRLGVDVPSAQEQPVPGEHARTPGEHVRTAAEARRTASEHDHTPGWHDRAASEIQPTASERTRVASEHRRSAGEHRPGDVQWARSAELPPVPRTSVDAEVPRSALGRRTVAALRDRESLARAIVLKEILGPPVGLRSPDDSSF